MRIKAVLADCLKYTYIVLPVPEAFRFQLKSVILWLLTPIIRGSASYRFWQEQLALAQRDTSEIADECIVGATGDRPRLLLIDACTPTPDRDSGSIDVFNSVRILIDSGFDITFIPEGNLLYAGRYTRSLQALGVHCLYQPEVKSVSDWLRAHGSLYTLVILFRAPIAIRHLSNIRRFCPQAKVIFSTLDLQFLRESRKNALKTADSQPFQGWVYQAELEAIQRADAVIVISDVEKAILHTLDPELLVFTVPLIREIPGRGSNSFSARKGVLFIGNYQHPPNLDGLMYFIKRIWPSIRAAQPDIELYVVGSYMPEFIRAYSDQGIRPFGYLEDLQAIMNQTRLAIAPLQYGAGLKGKVATYLGYGVPTVITPPAAEGMGLTHGEDTLITDDPETFAAYVLQAYGDEDLWQHLSDNGLSRVSRLYSLDVSRNRYKECFARLGLAFSDPE